MANEDILGGLRSALSRGYSLEEAMLSMYNAGYKKEDIEDAARNIQMQAPAQNAVIQTSVLPSFPQMQKQQPVTQVKMQNIKKPIENLAVSPAQQSSLEQAQEKQIQKPGAVARVSKYSSYEARLRTISVILVILLVILLGILGVIFIFKQEIISFFNSIF